MGDAEELAVRADDLLTGVRAESSPRPRLRALRRVVADVAAQQDAKLLEAVVHRGLLLFHEWNPKIEHNAMLRILKDVGKLPGLGLREAANRGIFAYSSDTHPAGFPRLFDHPAAQRPGIDDPEFRVATLLEASLDASPRALGVIGDELDAIMSKHDGTRPVVLGWAQAHAEDLAGKPEAARFFSELVDRIGVAAPGNVARVNAVGRFHRRLSQAQRGPGSDGRGR